MDFKNRKICLFPQGLLHVFGQKFKICLSFLLRPNGPRRCVWWRSTQQNNLFRLQKHRFQIVEKFAFFQRGLSMVVVKVLKFLYPFLLGQRSQEEVFGNFLERQLVFWDCKNIDFKNSQIFPFSMVSVKVRG